MHTTLQSFLPTIQKLHRERSLTKKDLLTESFLLEKDGDLNMFYAPHNEYINKEAKVVIVGITPGWNQMKTAYEQFIKSQAAGDNIETCLKATKTAARFAGSMKANLLSMLNECNIPKALQLPNAESLFEGNNHLLHTTSVIKYPVFLNGKNYTGHHPPIERAALLQRYAYGVFPNELAQIVPAALVIPLGKTVEKVISTLIKKNMLPPQHTYIVGFPHPSGANGHRRKQLEQQKQNLHDQVQAWVNKID